MLTLRCWDLRTLQLVEYATAMLTSSPELARPTTTADTRVHQIICGGVSATGALLNDVWLWDGRAWSHTVPQGPLPAAREMHSCAMLPSGAFLIFGGRGARVQVLLLLIPIRLCMACQQGCVRLDDVRSMPAYSRVPDAYNLHCAAGLGA